MSKSNNEPLRRGFTRRDPVSLMKIIRTLNKTGGSLEQSAKRLDINKWTLKRWIDAEPKLTEAYKQARIDAIAADKARTHPIGWRERLLALWNEAHDRPEILGQRDFSAWSGTTKDLLLGLGLVRSGDGYAFGDDPPKARAQQ